MQPECNPFHLLCCYIERTTSCTWQTWLVILRRSVTASSLPSLRSHLNNLAASSRFLPGSPPPNALAGSSSILGAASLLLPCFPPGSPSMISPLPPCFLPGRMISQVPQISRCYGVAPSLLHSGPSLNNIAASSLLPLGHPPMIPQIPQISRCHVAASSLLPLGLSLNNIAASSLLPCFLPRPTPPMISQIPQIFRCHVAASSPLPSGFSLANIAASSQLPP